MMSIHRACMRGVQMPPKQLRSPEGEETSDEFVEAELEMLAMGARNIPQGTALGAASFLLLVVLGAQNPPSGSAGVPKPAGRAQQSAGFL